MTLSLIQKSDLTFLVVQIKLSLYFILNSQNDLMEQFRQDDLHITVSTILNIDVIQLFASYFSFPTIWKIRYYDWSGDLDDVLCTDPYHTW